MSKRTIQEFQKRLPELPRSTQKAVASNAAMLNAVRLCDAANDLLDPATMKFDRAATEKCFRDAVFLATGIRIRSRSGRFNVESK